MKKVLSISLGSPARDHIVCCELLGEQLEIERRGTNGDFDKAVALFREHDGAVDAFGVGGIEFFLRVGDRRYPWRDARQIRSAIRRSKVGDGNRVKAVLEQRAVAALSAHLLSERRKPLAQMSALITTATERYDLASALTAAGCVMTYGDFIFGLGMPVPLHSMKQVRTLARLMLPVVTRLPYRWFYDIGEDQLAEPDDKFRRFYERHDIIAGDFLQIRSNMPADLSGKVFLTNTTTRADVEELERRNLGLLVTSTPRLGGRSFGTNVIEAILLALIDKPDAETTTEDLAGLIDQIPFEPNVEVLNR